MTTVHIDTDDKNKLQEFLELAVQKFHFQIQVETHGEIALKSHTNFNSLSSKLDWQIRNAKSVNTQKADSLKQAMESLNALVDPDKKNLSTKETKEQYFNSKATNQ